jgi:hypothetical protein
VRCLLLQTAAVVVQRELDYLLVQTAAVVLEELGCICEFSFVLGRCLHGHFVWTSFGFVEWFDPANADL